MGLTVGAVLVAGTMLLAPKEPELAKHESIVLKLPIASADAKTALTPGIDLPELDDGTSTEIVADNVRAAAILYFAYALEEMQFFAAMDRVIESFYAGMLPVDKGTRDKILRYAQDDPDRLTAEERRRMYASTFGGASSSETDAAPNRDFEPLFRRFLGAVAAYERQQAEPSATPKVSAASVRQAARSLAANVSLHGHGATRFVAGKLRDRIALGFEILADPSVLAAVGATDAWHAIAKLAAADPSKLRTRAATGAIALAWLAEHTAEIDTKAIDAALRNALQDPNRPLGSLAPQWLSASGLTAAQALKTKLATGSHPLAAWCLSATHRLVPCPRKG